MFSGPPLPHVCTCVWKHMKAPPHLAGGGAQHTAPIHPSSTTGPKTAYRLERGGEPTPHDYFSLPLADSRCEGHRSRSLYFAE